MKTMMDAKMKGMVMAAMSALCLVLGIMGAMGSTWLTADYSDEEQEMADEMGIESSGAALNYGWIIIDGDVSESECEDTIEATESGIGGTASCDSDGVMTVEMPFSETCDDTDDEDSCDMATGGMIGTIGMWAGIVCALLITLTMVLPMAGVDVMDAVPENVTQIATWGAGALMLVGMLGWYFMLPDGGDMALGMSGMMAGAAMSMGLGSALIGQFIPENE